MSEELPSDAALLEAARRAGWFDTSAVVKDCHVGSPQAHMRGIILAARLIEKHEPETLVSERDKLAAEAIRRARRANLYFRHEDVAGAMYDLLAERGMLTKCSMCGGKGCIPVTTPIGGPNAGWADCPQCHDKVRP